MKLQQWVTELFADAQSEAHLAAALGELGDRLGASSYGAARFGSAEHGDAVNELVAYPAGYEQTADVQAADAAFDPVMQHLRLSSVPIAWDRDTYERAGQRGMFEHMADHGLQSGVAVAMHLADCRHFVLGFNWNAAPRVRDPEVVSLMQMCAAYAEPAFFRVWTAMEMADVAAQDPLSQRECECIYWAGRGYTDKVIGGLLSVSPRTVERHVQSAMHKLLAANRTEAAVTATRLGLTHCFHAKYGYRSRRAKTQ